ncbi:MAG: hypothetical protein ACD_62C00033G0002 [uncultured bacterium]|nr:MAG: hypothetical protein ACD_62C00033G0002 [uncultured bacterium]
MYKSYRIIRSGTSNIFIRDVWPLRMVRDDLGTFQSFDKKQINSLLALPSAGGAAILSLSTCPSLPMTSLLRALGVI